MGKYLKTPMDHKIIDYLSIELFKLDPSNEHLNNFMAMKNEEGYNISKTINKFKKTNEIYWNSVKVEEKLSNSREKMVRYIEMNRNLSRSYVILVKYGENPWNSREK